MSEVDGTFERAAIVLGGGLRVVEKDGSKIYMPELQVVERLNKAHELLVTGVVDCIITTGKYSKRVGIDPTISGPQTEAEVGKKYLTERFNISAEKILMETESYDTIGNAWFVKVLCLFPNRIFRMVVITSDYHMERSRWIFSWVMGSDYQIDYCEVSSSLPSSDLVERGRLERIFIKLMLEKLMPAISNGDDVRLKYFMEHEHLRYCLSPLSEAMFEAFMQTAAIKAGYRQK